MKKILVLDRDTLGHDDLLRLFKELVGDWLTDLVSVDCIELFNKKLTEEGPWEIAVIHFHSEEFWAITGLEIETFLTSIREVNQQIVIIGITGNTYQKKLLEQHHIRVIYKSYDRNQLVYALGIKNAGIKISSIKDIVCEYYQVPFEKLSQETRKRKIVTARQVSIYLAKEFTHFSLKEIGNEFNRDHSTVIHSCDTVKDHMDSDPVYRENVLLLAKMVSPCFWKTEGLDG